MLNRIFCRIFHNIKTIESCKFIDIVSGRVVGQHECTTCNKRFMANYKRSWYRVYN